MHREDGPPAWTFPHSFDVLSKVGFWQAKFTPKFESKFEIGLINTSMKTVLPFNNSTAGQTSFAPSGSGGMTLPIRFQVY